MIDLGDWNEILSPLFQAEEYKKMYSDTLALMK